MANSDRDTLLLALGAVALGVGAFLYNRRSASAAEVPADRTQPAKALPTPSRVAAAPPAPVVTRTPASTTNGGSGATFSDSGAMTLDAIDVPASQAPVEPPTNGPGVPQRSLTSAQLTRYKRFLTGMGFTSGRWSEGLTGTLTSAVEAFQRSFNTLNQNRVALAQRPMAPVTVTVDGNLGPSTQKALEHFWELEATVEPLFAAVPGAATATPTGQDAFSAWRGTSTGLDATHDAEGNYIGPLQQLPYAAPSVPEQALNAGQLLRYKQIFKGLGYSPEGLSPTVNSAAWREMILRFQNAYNSENAARAAVGSGRTPFEPLRLATWGLLDLPTQRALEHHVNFIVADYVP